MTACLGRLEGYFNELEDNKKTLALDDDSFISQILNDIYNSLTLVVKTAKCHLLQNLQQNIEEIQLDECYEQLLTFQNIFYGDQLWKLMSKISCLIRFRNGTWLSGKY